METFANSAVVGRWAEYQAAVYYMGLGYAAHNVAQDKFYQALDVDLDVEGIGLVEVKGDTYTTGNVYIERVSNLDNGKPGCLMYTAADLIFYYFVSQGRALLLPVPALKEWAAARLLAFPAKHPRTVQRDGSSYGSTGHPVPERVLRAEVPGTVELVGLPLFG